MSSIQLLIPTHQNRTSASLSLHMRCRISRPRILWAQATHSGHLSWPNVNEWPLLRWRLRPGYVFWRAGLDKRKHNLLQGWKGYAISQNLIAKRKQRAISMYGSFTFAIKQRLSWVAFFIEVSISQCFVYVCSWFISTLRSLYFVCNSSVYVLCAIG